MLWERSGWARQVAKLNFVFFDPSKKADLDWAIVSQLLRQASFDALRAGRNPITVLGYHDQDGQEWLESTPGESTAEM